MSSKKARRCPSCGAQIQQGMRYCGRCGFDTQSKQRPAGQQRPAQQKSPQSEKKKPQPTSRPSAPPPDSELVRELELAQKRALETEPERPEPEPVPGPESEFAPTPTPELEPGQEPESELPPELMLPRPVRAQRPQPAREQQPPRPAGTARRGAAPRDRETRRNTARMALVIAATVLIVAAAIILVIKMNEPVAEPQQQSETFEPVHVIGTEDEQPTASPTPTEVPSPTPEPTATPEPPPTAEPEPSTSPEVVAAADDTVYVTGAGVNLRTGPGTTYEIVTTLARGTELHRTGTADGWSQVDYNGGSYYISNSLISTERPEVTVTPTPEPAAYTVTEASGTVVVVSPVNIRSGPGTGYSILEVAQQGAELTRTGTVGSSWTRVTVNDKEGFVYNSYIRDKSAAPEGESTGKLTIVSRANIRSGPGTGYGILGVAEVGESFDTYESGSSSWYLISYNGQKGYVYYTLVTKA